MSVLAMADGSALRVGYIRFALALLFFSAITGAVADVNGTFRWCVVGDGDYQMCQNLTSRLTVIDPFNHTWTCIKESDDDVCMDNIKNNLADMMMLDGAEIYEAQKEANLKPILKEEIPGSYMYYGVAVVKASFCGANSKLSDLKGKGSCHTGYGRSTGWILPIYNMSASTPPVMPLVNTNARERADVETLTSFFKTTCAATSADDATTRLCTGCPDQCDEDKSIYYDYDGAFRCLVEGKGDVAFTKNSIPALYSKGARLANPSWTGLEESDAYRLLCPSGGCKSVDSFLDCNFGGIPPHALVVRSNWPADEINETQIAFARANNDPNIKDMLFSKGNNEDSALFSSDCTGTAPVTGTGEEYLGADFVKMIKYVKEDMQNQPLTQMADAVSSLTRGSLSSWIAGMLVVAIVFALSLS